MTNFLKKFPVISGVVSVITLSIMALIAGTVDYDWARSGRCYGTGCYGAGNGTGSGYYRINFTMFSGVEIDDDALGLTIVFAIMTVLMFLIFLFAILSNLNKMKFSYKARLTLTIIFDVCLFTFCIWNTINAANSAYAGGDILSVFAFLLFFFQMFAIIFEGVARKKASTGPVEAIPIDDSKEA